MFPDFLFPKLAFSFAGEGSEGGGSGAADGGEGSGGSAPAATDEKGGEGDIDYKAEYEKYKGVDLKKWERLKDLDPDEYDRDRDILGPILDDEDFFNHVTKIATAIRSGKKFIELFKQAPSAGAGQPAKGREGDRQDDNHDPRVDKLLQERDQERTERVTAEFDASFDKALETVLKEKKVELLDHEIEGGGVFRSDREDVKRFVEDAFIRDWQESQRKRTQPKLSTKDIPALVTKALDALNGYWTKGIQKRVKLDASPEHPAGGSGEGFRKNEKPPKDKNERIDRVREDLKRSSQFAGQTG